MYILSNQRNIWRLIRCFSSPRYKHACDIEREFISNKITQSEDIFAKNRTHLNPKKHSLSRHEPDRACTHTGLRAQVTIEIVPFHLNASDKATSRGGNEFVESLILRDLPQLCWGCPVRLGPPFAASPLHPRPELAPFPPPPLLRGWG